MKKNEGLQKIYDIIKELYGDDIEVTLTVTYGCIDINVAEPSYMTDECDCDDMTIGGRWLSRRAEM